MKQQDYGEISRIPHHTKVLQVKVCGFFGMMVG